MSIIGCTKNTTTNNTITADVTITVDFSATATTVKSMVGFIHAMSATQPASNYITDLSPAYWRAGTLMSTIYPRINQFHAKPILVISDLYRYPGDNVVGWKQPFEDTTAWKNFVGNVYTQGSLIGDSVVYDVWNEPNGIYFWTGTRQQLFETFKRAHDKIRSLPNGNNAFISGPSLNGLDTAFIRPFLDYCLVNNIKLDVFSWHEFRTDEKINDIATNITQIRTLVNSTKYAPLQIKQIHLNELGGASAQFKPGSILAYFSALEKGGANAACRACWDESTGINNCFNNTLNGLLTPNSFNPRAAWWAYRYYNLSINKRVPSISSNTNVVSYASTSSENANELQILVGYYGDVDNADKSININLRNLNNVDYLNGKTTVHVKIQKIPNSGEQAILQPSAISQTTENIINGTITVPIQNIGLNEVFVVQVY